LKKLKLYCHKKGMTLKTFSIDIKEVI